MSIGISVKKLGNFRTFGQNFNDFWQKMRNYLLFGTLWTYFGKLVISFGKFSTTVYSQLVKLVGVQRIQFKNKNIFFFYFLIIFFICLISLTTYFRSRCEQFAKSFKLENDQRCLDRDAQLVFLTFLFPKLFRK